MRPEITYSGYLKTCRYTAVKSAAIRRFPWPATWSAERTIPRLFIRGRDQTSETEELLRILRFVVYANFVVDVRTGAAAGAAEESDLSVLGYCLSHRNGVPVQMTVDGRNTVTMADFDNFSVIGLVPGVGDDPRCRGVYRRH